MHNNHGHIVLLRPMLRRTGPNVPGIQLVLFLSKALEQNLYLDFKWFFVLIAVFNMIDTKTQSIGNIRFRATQPPGAIGCIALLEEPAVLGWHWRNGFAGGHHDNKKNQIERQMNHGNSVRSTVTKILGALQGAVRAATICAIYCIRYIDQLLMSLGAK